MALHHSPKIVTDGLVFYYDKANTKKSWIGEPITNLAMTSGEAIDWTVSNLSASVTRATITANSKYSITSATGGAFRILFNVSNLVNAETYNLSFKYSVQSGGPSFDMNDWCDTGIAKTEIDLGAGVYFQTAYGSRATYDSTYRFMDFNISANTVVHIWDVQLENRAYYTPYTPYQRANTEAIIDLTASNTITATSLTYTQDDFSFDGSGTNDGVTAGDSLTVPTSITNTNNYSNGCTYSWWMKLDATNTETRRAIFFGNTTIQHLELNNINGTSPVFRTEATLQNGYSFGTGVIPGGALEGRYVYTTVVFANAESTRPVRWYSNGVLFHTGSMDGGLNPGTEYFQFSQIGRSTGNVTYQYSKSFFGELPALAINGKALTAAEVLQNFNATRAKYGI